MTTNQQSYTGQCTCGFVHYQMLSKPLFVHCCHCSWCIRESGAAFAVNALIEADRVEVLTGHIEKTTIPTNSGKGQTVARCPKCLVALWSNYAGAGDTINFVRVGTLTEPHKVPPDIHIFTETKQPWLTLTDNIPSVTHYYKAADFWPQESLDRRDILRKTKFH